MEEKDIVVSKNWFANNINLVAAANSTIRRFNYTYDVITYRDDYSIYYELIK